METEQLGLLPLFGTWQPGPVSRTPESPDTYETENFDTDMSPADAGEVVSFASFNNRNNPGPRPPGLNNRFRNTTQNGRAQSGPNTSGRGAYWSTTGPKTELRRILGSSLELPIIAPSSAPPDDKKLILSLTKERIEEHVTGDWPSKTSMLSQRFVAAVPNALNDAKVRLAKLKDYTSPVFTYGMPKGYTIDHEPSDINNTSVLRYLAFEMRVLPQKAPPIQSPVPGLPEEFCLQVLLKVPLNQFQSDVNEAFSLNILQGDPARLLEKCKSENLSIIFGKYNNNGFFDTDAFDREMKRIQGQCMFMAVYAVLLRDYVGKGIIKDIHKRLRECRQIMVHNGQYRVKSVNEQHADFMRLVQEFDVDEPIKTNLPDIAYHNFSTEIKQELTHMEYEPPTTCSTNEEQYRLLSELHAKATEAESRIKQVTSLIRRVGGTRNQSGSATFLTTPSTSEFPQKSNTSSMPPQFINDASILQHYGEDPVVQSLHAQAAQYSTLISVCENSLRKASGEVAPSKCWGCGDIPDYAKDCFHRYRSCPNKADPRVATAFKAKLEEHYAKLAPSRGPRTQRYPPRSNPSWNRNSRQSPYVNNNRPRTLMVAPEGTDEDDQPVCDTTLSIEEEDPETPRSSNQQVISFLTTPSCTDELWTNFGISPETFCDGKPSFSINLARPIPLPEWKVQSPTTPDWAEDWASSILSDHVQVFSDLSLDLVQNPSRYENVSVFSDLNLDYLQPPSQLERVFSTVTTPVDTNVFSAARTLCDMKQLAHSHTERSRKQAFSPESDDKRSRTIMSGSPNSHWLIEDINTIPHSPLNKERAASADTTPGEPMLHAGSVHHLTHVGLEAIKIENQKMLQTVSVQSVSVKSPDFLGKYRNLSANKSLKNFSTTSQSTVPYTELTQNLSSYYYSKHPQPEAPQRGARKIHPLQVSSNMKFPSSKSLPTIPALLSIPHRAPALVREPLLSQTLEVIDEDPVNSATNPASITPQGQEDSTMDELSEPSGILVDRIHDQIPQVVEIPEQTEGSLQDNLEIEDDLEVQTQPVEKESTVPSSMPVPASNIVLHDQDPRVQCQITAELDASTVESMNPGVLSRASSYSVDEIRSTASGKIAPTRPDTPHIFGRVPGLLYDEVAVWEISEYNHRDFTPDSIRIIFLSEGNKPPGKPCRFIFVNGLQACAISNTLFGHIMAGVLDVKPQSREEADILAMYIVKHHSIPLEDLETEWILIHNVLVHTGNKIDKNNYKVSKHTASWIKYKNARIRCIKLANAKYHLSELSFHPINVFDNVKLEELQAKKDWQHGLVTFDEFLNDVAVNQETSNVVPDEVLITQDSPEDIDNISQLGNLTIESLTDSQRTESEGSQLHWNEIFSQAILPMLQMFDTSRLNKIGDPVFPEYNESRIERVIHINPDDTLPPPNLSLPRSIPDNLDFPSHAAFPNDLILQMASQPFTSFTDHLQMAQSLRRFVQQGPADNLLAEDLRRYDHFRPPIEVEPLSKSDIGLAHAMRVFDKAKQTRTQGMRPLYRLGYTPSPVIRLVKKYQTTADIFSNKTPLGWILKPLGLPPDTTWEKIRDCNLLSDGDYALASRYSLEPTVELQEVAIAGAMRQVARADHDMRSARKYIRLFCSPFGNPLFDDPLIDDIMTKFKEKMARLYGPDFINQQNAQFDKIGEKIHIFPNNEIRDDTVYGFTPAADGEYTFYLPDTDDETESVSSSDVSMTSENPPDYFAFTLPSISRHPPPKKRKDPPEPRHPPYYSADSLASTVPLPEHWDEPSNLSPRRKRFRSHKRHVVAKASQHHPDKELKLVRMEEHLRRLNAGVFPPQECRSKPIFEMWIHLRSGSNPVDLKVFAAIDTMASRTQIDLGWIEESAKHNKAYDELRDTLRSSRQAQLRTSFAKAVPGTRQTQADHFNITFKVVPSIASNFPVHVVLAQNFIAAYGAQIGPDLRPQALQERCLTQLSPYHGRQILIQSCNPKIYQVQQPFSFGRQAPEARAPPAKLGTRNWSDDESITSPEPDQDKAPPRTPSPIPKFQPARFRKGQTFWPNGAPIPETPPLGQTKETHQFNTLRYEDRERERERGLGPKALKFGHPRALDIKLSKPKARKARECPTKVTESPNKGRPLPSPSAFSPIRKKPPLGQDSKPAAVELIAQQKAPPETNWLRMEQEDAAPVASLPKNPPPSDTSKHSNPQPSGQAKQDRPHIPHQFNNNSINQITIFSSSDQLPLARSETPDELTTTARSFTAIPRAIRPPPSDVKTKDSVHSFTSSEFEYDGSYAHTPIPWNSIPNFNAPLQWAAGEAWESFKDYPEFSRDNQWELFDFIEEKMEHVKHLGVTNDYGKFEFHRVCENMEHDKDSFENFLDALKNQPIPRRPDKLPELIKDHVDDSLEEFSNFTQDLSNNTNELIKLAEEYLNQRYNRASETGRPFKEFLEFVQNREDERSFETFLDSIHSSPDQSVNEDQESSDKIIPVYGAVSVDGESVGALSTESRDVYVTIPIQSEKKDPEINFQFVKEVLSSQVLAAYGLRVFPNVSGSRIHSQPLGNSEFFQDHSLFVVFEPTEDHFTTAKALDLKRGVFTKCRLCRHVSATKETSYHLELTFDNNWNRTWLFKTNHHLGKITVYKYLTREEIEAESPQANPEDDLEPPQTPPPSPPHDQHIVTPRSSQRSSSHGRNNPSNESEQNQNQNSSNNTPPCCTTNFKSIHGRPPTPFNHETSKAKQIIDTLVDRATSKKEQLEVAHTLADRAKARKDLELINQTLADRDEASDSIVSDETSTTADMIVDASSADSLYCEAATTPRIPDYISLPSRKRKQLLQDNSEQRQDSACRSLARNKKRSRSERQRPHETTTLTMMSRIPVVTSVLQTNPSRTLAVAITERLPHLLFPIGPRNRNSSWKHLATIRGVFDTGSGITIGYLKYWKSVAERYPEFVEEFDTMDAASYEKLRIGSIEKNGEGALCTHYIVLRTPFTSEGRPVTLRVALTDGLSCNLIFGLPFICKAKMIAHLAERYVDSSVFKAAFKMEFHAPELRDSVVEQGEEVVALCATETDGHDTMIEVGGTRLGV